MYFRPFIYTIACCAALVGGVATAQNAALDNLVLGSVNGEEITRREVVARLVEYYGEDALQKMIGRVLVAQAAKKHNLSVSNQELETRLVQIHSQFKTEKDFQDFLKGAALTEKQHREEVRYTLLLQKIALKETPI